MSKQAFFSILFFACAAHFFAQAGVHAPGKYEFSAKDCFVPTRYHGSFLKDSLKANHVLSGQRLWRVISLEDLQNKQLFNSNKGCTQVSLFEVIKFGLLEKQLNAFSSDDFNKAATSRLTPEQKKNSLMVRDSNEVVIFDKNGEEKKEIVVGNRFYLGSDVTCFLLKEDWVLNANTGKTTKYIVALAPLVFDPKTQSVQPLFWLYYAEWKELFGCFMTKSAYADEPMTYSDIFSQRKFISQISKENNVFDRSIRSIHHGEDIRQQDHKIKEKLNNGEADHFDH